MSDPKTTPLTAKDYQSLSREQWQSMDAETLAHTFYSYRKILIQTAHTDPEVRNSPLKTSRLNTLNSLNEDKETNPTLGETSRKVTNELAQFTGVSRNDTTLLLNVGGLIDQKNGVDIKKKDNITLSAIRGMTKEEWTKMDTPTLSSTLQAYRGHLIKEAQKSLGKKPSTVSRGKLAAYASVNDDPQKYPTLDRISQNVSLEMSKSVFFKDSDGNTLKNVNTLINDRQRTHANSNKIKSAKETIR
jgi:hypothetical protein